MKIFLWCCWGLALILMPTQASSSILEACQLPDELTLPSDAIPIHHDQDAETGTLTNARTGEVILEEPFIYAVLTFDHATKLLVYGSGENERDGWLRMFNVAVNC